MLWSAPNYVPRLTVSVWRPSARVWRVIYIERNRMHSVTNRHPSGSSVDHESSSTGTSAVHQQYMIVESNIKVYSSAELCNVMSLFAIIVVRLGPIQTLEFRQRVVEQFMLSTTELIGL